MSEQPQTNAAPHAGQAGNTSIELGQKIFSSDGHEVGKVDSLVLDYNTREVQSIICRSGVLLTKDRIIPIGMVAKQDGENNLLLNITVSEVHEQQEFVEREHRAMTADEAGPMPMNWAIGSGQTPYYFYPPSNSIGYREDAPFFANAPLAPPDLEVQSNLPEDSSRLDTGTVVLGSDGKKLGMVEDVTYTEDGDITSFVVKAGFLFHHDIEIPAKLIANISDEHVHLTIPADQVESTHDHS